MKKTVKPILISLAGSLFLFGTLGCSTPLTTREKAAAIGTAAGAGVGAIIGGATGHPGAGAAIGGAVGLGTGAIVGDQLQKREQVAEEQRKEIERQKEELARNREILEELKKRDIEARETERGVVINFPDVQFEFDKATLTEGARIKVRDITTVLKTKGRGKRLAVEGHADSIGNEDYNQRLSERRAASVARALQNGGISRQLITTRGLGELFPVAPNDNAAGRAKNRRVEVVVENEGSREVVETVR